MSVERCFFTPKVYLADAADSLVDVLTLIRSMEIIQVIGIVINAANLIIKVIDSLKRTKGDHE